ncbi:hypothetical protein ACUW9A_003278 [Sphingomonas sanguinis]
MPSHHVRDPLPSAKSESRLHRRRKHAFFNSLDRFCARPLWEDKIALLSWLRPSPVDQ